MRVLQRSSVAVLAVGLVGALAVPGCGSTPTEQADAPTPTTMSEPTSEPTAQAEPVPTPLEGPVEALIGELPAAGIVCDHEGEVGVGDVLACEHPDGRGVLVSIVDDEGTWVGAASDRFPTTATGLDAFHADLGLGDNCTDLFAQDLLLGADDLSRYVVGLAYFYLDGQSYLMDIDENGAPCETLFNADLVSEVFAGGWFDVAYPLVPAAPTVDQLTAELTEAVSWQGQGWVCTAVTAGPLGYGSVLRCTPDPEPRDTQFPLVTMLMLDDETWVAAESGLNFPLLMAEQNNSRPGAMPGVNCTDLLAPDSPFSQLASDLTPEQTYFGVLLHFFMDGRPTPLMDIDSNGIPCETLFSPDVVARVWEGGFLPAPGMIR